MVGAAGFEPTITGSKPDALPLGYAPIKRAPDRKAEPVEGRLLSAILLNCNGILRPIDVFSISVNEVMFR